VVNSVIKHNKLRVEQKWWTFVH